MVTLAFVSQPYRVICSTLYTGPGLETQSVVLNRGLKEYAGDCQRDGSVFFGMPIVGFK